MRATATAVRHEMIEPVAPAPSSLEIRAFFRRNPFFAPPNLENYTVNQVQNHLGLTARDSSQGYCVIMAANSREVLKARLGFAIQVIQADPSKQIGIQYMNYKEGDGLVSWEKKR